MPPFNAMLLSRIAAGQSEHLALDRPARTRWRAQGILSGPGNNEVSSDYHLTEQIRRARSRGAEGQFRCSRLWLAFWCVSWSIGGRPNACPLQKAPTGQKADRAPDSRSPITSHASNRGDFNPLRSKSCGRSHPPSGGAIITRHRAGRYLGRTRAFPRQAIRISWVRATGTLFAIPQGYPFQLGLGPGGRFRSRASASLFPPGDFLRCGD